MGLFPARSTRKNIWLYAVVGIVVLIIGWRIWQLQSGRDRRGFDSAVPVATATATRGDLTLFLNGLGTVTPASAVVVKSRVDGQLLRVHFKEGQFVKAGDLLAEIDPRPFEVQLQQAQGQLARDSAQLKNAQVDLARYQLLWSQDSIAKQEVDAQAALVRQYDGAVKVDVAQVADAKLQLTYANITAPISGRVGLRQVDPGNIVHAADTSGIVSIAQVRPIDVVFTLPEDNLPRLMQQVHAGAKIPIDAYDRALKLKLATGRLLAVDNEIDTTTGTVKLKAVFDNADDALFPNQFVNVRMPIETLHDVVLVPVAAVQSGTQGDFVYAVQDDGTVKLSNVNTGANDGEHVVIDSGIAAATQIVVEGVEKLRDGSAVDVVQRDGRELGKPAAGADTDKRRNSLWQRIKNSVGAGGR